MMSARINNRDGGGIAGRSPSSLSAGAFQVIDPLLIGGAAFGTLIALWMVAVEMKKRDARDSIRRHRGELPPDPSPREEPASESVQNS